MAQMSAKEARRRGMTTKTAYPRSTDPNANIFANRDVKPSEVARYDATPIMFGGLGNVNWFGNEPEAKVAGGSNMHVSGLYGAPMGLHHGVGQASEDEAALMAYLGNVPQDVATYKDPDFYLGAGTFAILGAGALFFLKMKGRI